MRAVVAAMLIWATATSTVAAAPGVTTTEVNFRSGPGTKFTILRTLPSGTAVDIGDCDDGGSWCAAKVEGRNGFVSGQYLKETDDPLAWPRTYQTDKGRIVLYQPQFTDWTDYKSIEALVAAEYTKTPNDQPVFGVIGLKGDTSFDEEADEIIISNITISTVSFSALDREDVQALTLETGKLLPTGSITVPESRVAASLAEQQRVTEVSGIKSDPPRIFTATSPALLVQTDGPPAFAPVKGKAGLSFVVNTNWDLFRADKEGTLFLRDDTHWLTAKGIDQPWTPVKALPPLLTGLPQDGNWDDARASSSPQPYAEGDLPKIISVDRPSELILFDGDPVLEDVPGTSLQWTSNTETDVFFDKVKKHWYVLLSGRWYRAVELKGPWIFATTSLPDDFLDIPEDAPYYAVRASIPGTSEAAEARLRASIPTTARVEKGSINPTVTYWGKAHFEPVEGTDLAYATNTTATVIKVEAKYFVLQDGVWFVGDSPEGPWTLASEVPEDIYEIPPSSPLYNATYVRVYNTEANAVWYSYTMGYLSCYLVWDTCVYGTGWYYPPYWYDDDDDDYDYPIYNPQPVTWGSGNYYNPVRGVYGRYGYAYGPYRGIAGVRTWNPSTGTYGRAGAVWGPNGSAGFVAASNPRTDSAGYVAGGRNVYGAWKSAGVKRGSEWARITAREGAGGSSTLRWKTSEGQGFIHEGRRGDMYAGRNGQVYRNTGDGWQEWDGGWQDVTRPERGELLEGAEGLRDLSPEARDRLRRSGGGEVLGGLAGAGAASAIRERSSERPNASQRPAQARGLPASLDKDVRARNRGNQRQISAKQYSRPKVQAYKPRGGGGGGSYRGGGGGSRMFITSGRGGRGGGGGGRGGGRR